MVTEGMVLAGGLFTGLGLSVYFVYYCLRHPDTRGSGSLAVFFVGVALWLSADIIQLLTPETSLPAVGVQIRVLGPDIAVVGFLLFALEYTGRNHLINKKTLALLAIKPVATLALVLSPYRNLLVDPATDTVPTVGYDLTVTPLFFVHTAYSWTLTITALLLLAHMMVQARYGYQRQIVAVLFAVLVPFAFNILARTGTIPYDLTASAFFVTATIILYATFRLRLMDALPIARQTVLEEISDVVIVCDETGTIITTNDATTETFDREDQLVGEQVDDLFEGDVLPSLEDGQRREIRAMIDDEPRTLAVDSSTIRDYRDNVIAQVLVFRDVTEQKRREEKLRDREENLQLLKDLQSRFLRHNLRNELNVVRLEARELIDEDDPEDVERFETILEKTDRILDWSTKAGRIEKLVQADETVTCNVTEQIERIVETMETEHPTVTFERDLTDDGWIRAVPQAAYAIENVIDNAARYNTAEEPWVRIAIERDGDDVIVRVTDNGPGIDESELDVIRKREENPLEHGSGLGLWLVYWVVEKSGGDVTFETGDGTTVVLRFRSVPGA